MSNPTLTPNVLLSIFYFCTQARSKSNWIFGGKMVDFWRGVIFQQLAITHAQQQQNEHTTATLPLATSLEFATNSNQQNNHGSILHRRGDQRPRHRRLIAHDEPDGLLPNDPRPIASHPARKEQRGGEAERHGAGRPFPHRDGPGPHLIVQGSEWGGY